MTPPLQAPPPADRQTYLVRHGSMRFLGEFVGPPGIPIRRRDAVIVRTERGQEVGEALGPATPQALSAIPEPTRGEIIRPFAPEDQAKVTHLKDVERKEFAAAERLIAHHKLAMQLVDVEHLFGGERIVFYFLAEHR